MAALGVAATFVWFGMVLAISFLEAPLKFRAPGVTLPIGLAIGRLVFRALNVAELVLGAAVLAAVGTAAEYDTVATIASLGALGALAGQLAVVRPRLHRRTARVLAGNTDGPRSRPHLEYVALEVVKAIALLVAGIALLTA
ncbi:hypothetical protein GCM10020369_50550 [Cryptosporangium minutisporangium]|uniref:Transmembrane protein n=2 Tax=Cryptosporangium minutisporangium TaxID=113569 RepID=A0ABP6T3J2_9ACTN